MRHWDRLWDFRNQVNIFNYIYLWRQDKNQCVYIFLGRIQYNILLYCLKTIETIVGICSLHSGWKKARYFAILAPLIKYVICFIVPLILYSVWFTRRHPYQFYVLYDNPFHPCLHPLLFKVPTLFNKKLTIGTRNH